MATIIASCSWKDAYPLEHPPPDQIRRLPTIYFENVDPIVKIFHRPTILKMIESGTSSITKSQEALLYSIYFAAVTSLSRTCRNEFGQDYATLSRRYQLAIFNLRCVSPLSKRFTRVADSRGLEFMPSSSAKFTPRRRWEEAFSVRCRDEMTYMVADRDPRYPGCRGPRDGSHGS